MLLLARRCRLESWNGQLWCLKLVKATYVDDGGRIFKQSAEQLSHVTERERLAQEAVRESQDPGCDVDHVSDEETELPQQPSQTSGQENNVAPVSPSDVPMPDLVPPETPDENAETSNDDRENSSSSQWEWRPDFFSGTWW